MDMDPKTTHMDPKLLAALRKLKAQTNGGFNPAHLAGPSQKNVRRHILECLTGEKVPLAKAGVNALCDALFAATGAKGNCLAAQTANFIEIAKVATGCQ